MSAGRSLADYIRVYEGALADDFCDRVVARFEAATAHHAQVDVPGTRRFTALTLSQTPGWGDVHELLLGHLLDSLKLYVRDTGVRSIPGDLAYEAFRIKRYRAGGAEQFGVHVDISNAARARRCLVAFWYLNDVREGGETEFPSLGVAVKPKKGLMLMFPPAFMYPHAGRPPVSGTKYIVGSYLLYV